MDVRSCFGSESDQVFSASCPSDLLLLFSQWSSWCPHGTSRRYLCGVAQNAHEFRMFWRSFRSSANARWTEARAAAGTGERDGESPKGGCAQERGELEDESSHDVHP